MKLLFSNLLNDGGPIFMYPTLLMLFLCLFFIIKTFISGDTNDTNKKLIHHISLFSLVWGFLGMMLGLIGAFDAMSMANDISTGVLAGGLKIALLSPSFGMVVFLIARLGLVGLTFKK
ncbi:MotA/TolQ/ExbB proton channel family protein [Tenacibaculum sp. 190524A02b]|uniref:MotA/TolQ/ExbB proton channel domain-containing protein n=1 Tax=Tenacibaculum vairaonense TaxID=3137860 RepID=A0ABP1F7R3_9FLAO